MDVWSSLLLQGSHQNAGIKHAICALGALHQNLRSTPIGPQAQVHLFAVEQYSKAIQYTVCSARKNYMSIDESLVMCILFTLLERLLGETELAVYHLRAGIKLLTDTIIRPKWRQQTTRVSDKATYISRATIIALLRRLERQVYQLGQTNVGFESPEMPLVKLDIPDVFSSLDEASTCFECYFNDACRMMGTVEWREEQQSQAQKPVEPDLVFLLNRVLTKWNKAFMALLDDAKSQHDLASERAQSIIHTLHLLRLILSISLAHYQKGDEMIYDRYMPEFKQAVAHCVAVVNAQKRVPEAVSLQCSSEDSVSPRTEMSVPISFESLPSPASVSDRHLPPGSSHQISFDCPGKTALSFSAFSPLHALLMISFRCRDPVVRRQAVQLLRDVNCCDAFWDSRILSVVAERIVQIEENGYLSGQEYSGYNQSIQKAEQVVRAARCHQIRAQFVKQHVFIIDYISINPTEWVPGPDYWENFQEESFCIPGRIRETITVVSWWGGHHLEARFVRISPEVYTQHHQILIYLHQKGNSSGFDGEFASFHEHWEGMCYIWKEATIPWSLR